MSDAVRVLLIDDNPDDEELYPRGLQMEGFRVEDVDKDDRLASVVESSDADVVVFHLNGIFMWDACERVCKSARVPIVLLTAHVRPDRANRDRARRLGIAAFVAKPCTPEDLGRVIKRVLAGERGLDVRSAR